MPSIALGIQRDTKVNNTELLLFPEMLMSGRGSWKVNSGRDGNGVLKVHSKPLRDAEEVR